MRASQVIDYLEKLAPLSLAEEWDNPGWQVGDPGEEVRGIMFTLDLTPAVVERSVQAGANLIISHHPLLFRPVSKLRLDQYPGSLIQRLIEHRLMLYTAHTNLDSAPQGISHTLGRVLGLQEMEVLGGSRRLGMFKLVVFVPESHLEAVREAICKAGAGWIGRYSDCTFRTPGTGTFRPREGTNPFLGRLGVLEEASEYRIETVVTGENREAVVKAMLQAHPYEEAAYDLYPLAEPVSTSGPARIGRLDAPMRLSQMVEMVKERLNVKHLLLSAARGEVPVERVAVCGGSGAEFISAAAQQGAQLLVTGDLKYHEAQEANRRGIAVIAAGHAATEQPGLQAAAAWLEKQLLQAGAAEGGASIPRVEVNQVLEDEIVIG
ncbi:MAG: Nif3-like dinuclear metal center hexameric protein [Firmicutes bacterium]|nr:Nif3-like dinuclear metal center hexameric protein [Bacillota bacterium]